MAMIQRNMLPHGMDPQKGQKFPDTPQGVSQISVDIMGAPTDDTSKYGKLLPALRNSSVKGAPVFVAKGSDKSYTAHQTAFELAANGKHQPARVFLNGIPTDNQEPNELLALARLEESIRVLGVLAQGTQDKHEGSGLFATAVDGAVNANNTSKFHATPGEKFYWALPSVDDAPSTVVPHGIRDGYTLICGPAEILGDLSFPSLVKQVEVNDSSRDAVHAAMDPLTRPSDSSRSPVEITKFVSTAALLDQLIVTVGVMANQSTSEIVANLTVNRKAFAEKLLARHVQPIDYVRRALPAAPAGRSNGRLADSLAGMTQISLAQGINQRNNRVSNIARDHEMGRFEYPSKPKSDCYVNLAM